jgi:hypothetical protein
VHAQNRPTQQQTKHTHLTQEAEWLNQQFYELLKIFKGFKIKYNNAFTRDILRYDSAIILTRVYTSDDGQERPKHLAIRYEYMKDENEC